MSPAEFAVLLGKLALELGPDIADVVRDLAAKRRPELVATEPPPRQDAIIASEDEAAIRKRFPL